jgi:hypothetical protein
MNSSESLLCFSTNFVNEEFRERFVREATKKPEKLLARICHSIDEVFPSRYRGKVVNFEPKQNCLMLGPKVRFEEVTWADAQRSMGFGNGLLVIDASGRKFYAETEGTPKHEVWGGDA